MIKILKSNKLTIFLILIICLIFASNPSFYANSCLNGLNVWAFKVFPVLFPFFIFTRIIVKLSNNSSNIMDKFFNKLYNSPNGSFQTFILSVLSGYPMGAKLIYNLYEDKKITTAQAKKMLSFCSISGPMFMLGTVGVSILCSYKAGLIILISNIIAALINGIIYRGKKEKLVEFISNKNAQENILSDCVYEALNSILMVGAYIILSFLIIDLLKSLNIISLISTTICSVFKETNKQVIDATLCGLLEITRGIIELNSTNINLVLKTIISSALIGFGGISIMLQSTHFISKLNISKKYIIMQKITQAIIALIVTIPLSLIFLN